MKQFFYLYRTAKILLEKKFFLISKLMPVIPATLQHVLCVVFMIHVINYLMQYGIYSINIGNTKTMEVVQ